MSILVDFSVFPLGKDESVSPYVARAAKIIEQSGLPCRIGPMGTAIEGEWDEISNLIARCLDDLGLDCDRIYFSLKGDLRKGPPGRMEGKLRSLKEKM